MKTIVTGISCLLCVVLLTSVRAQSEKMMRLGEVLLFSVVELKPEAEVKAFETFVLGEAAPAWKKNAPGMELHLVRADRGGRKAQTMLAWTTDTQARRKRYASPAGAPFAPDLRAKVGEAHITFAPFVKNVGPYVEYHLLSPEKVGPLPEVEILGNHYIKVRPDRREAFERFVAEKLHPAVGNLNPDLRLLYYKAVHGAEAGSYITLFALTNASRDKYWPKGTDSDDVRAAFKPVQALTPELSTYLVEGSYATGANMAAAVYESREWTDFVKVAPGR